MREFEEYKALEALAEGDEAIWLLERTGFRTGCDYIDVTVVGKSKTRLTVETNKQRLQFMLRTFKQYAPVNSARSVLVPKTDYWLAKRDEQRRLDRRSFMIAFVGDPKRIGKLTDEQLAALYETLKQFMAENEAAKKKAKEANG